MNFEIKEYSSYQLFESIYDRFNACYDLKSGKDLVIDNDLFNIFDNDVYYFVIKHNCGLYTLLENQKIIPSKELYNLLSCMIKPVRYSIINNIYYHFIDSFEDQFLKKDNIKYKKSNFYTYYDFISAKDNNILEFDDEENKYNFIFNTTYPADDFINNMIDNAETELPIHFYNVVILESSFLYSLLCDIIGILYIDQPNVYVAPEKIIFYKNKEHEFNNKILGYNTFDEYLSQLKYYNLDKMNNCHFVNFNNVHFWYKNNENFDINSDDIYLRNMDIII